MGLFSFESKQVKEWKKLAKSGDMEAQYHLARAYANGKGASINMKRAVDYCVQSAEQEYAPAQALLAHFYGYGKGVEKIYEEMIYWGEKAGNALVYVSGTAGKTRCSIQVRAIL